MFETLKGKDDLDFSADQPQDDVLGLGQSFMGGTPQSFQATDTDAWGTTPAETPAGPTKSAGTGQPAATTTNATQANTFDQARQLADLTRQAAAATNPRDAAVLRDQTARGIAKTLTDQGHKVTWQGNQLIVDGRAYVVGDGQPAGGQLYGSPSEPLDMTTQPVPMPGQEAPAANKSTWNTDGYAAPNYTAENPGAVMAGWDGAKWGDANHQTPKYVAGRILSQFPPTPEGLRQALPMLEQAYPGTKIVGTNGDKLDIPNVGIIDVGQSFGAGGGAWQWIDTAAEAGQADVLGGPSVLPASVSGAAGVDLSRPAPTPENTGAVLPVSPVNTSGFNQTAPTYTPGTIGMDDLQGFDLETMLQNFGAADGPTAVEQLPGYEAGSVTNDPMATYDFGGFGDLGELGAGDMEGLTEDAVRRLLEDPYSLSDLDIERLKAASKDELADMALLDDQELQRLMHQMGIADSNFAASERRAIAGNRDRALVQSNRTIDTAAAQTRKGDERAAADLAASYTDAKAGRARADRAQRLTEAGMSEDLTRASVDSKARAQQFDREGQVINEQLRGEAFDRTSTNTQRNIDNLFKSQAEQREAVQLATDASLRAAAMTGDRMALREQVAQKATELGQSADKLMLDYVMGLMDDATRRYGIDVDASLKREQLAQAGTEFLEDLVFRYAALLQDDAQFGANYGLGLGRLELDANNSAFDQWLKTVGGG